jgi:hypothetical protein
MGACYGNLPHDDVQEDHCCYDSTFDVIIDSEGQGHGYE